MQEIRSHNGPMKSISDVECLVNRFSTMGKLKPALRADFFFLKLILKQKSQLLIVSGRPAAHFNRLRKYFGAENDIPDTSIKDGLSQLPGKRKIHAVGGICPGVISFKTRSESINKRKR